MLTRPIKWDLIAQQYDRMVKYATALRLGTAESESILRRFTRGGPKHPTYQAPEGPRPRGAHHLRLRLPRRRRPAP
nr:Tn3 family transposase [Saccharomonospora iraqiensis]